MGIHATLVRDDFTPKADAVAVRDAQRRAAMELTLALIQGVTQQLTPVGVTSLLRGSWTSDPPLTLGSQVVGIMGSPLVYSEVIELGRRPGAAMPPPDALAEWVAVKMGGDVSPFVVARSIGRKGIKGREMLKKALETTRPGVSAIWSEHARTALESS